ncbi:serine carboxypeptidase 24-like [Andrographis paniculata]|uniref:serine carboxypeptidase 24-like n=1 Tax=Andrographis paniculata TaxID=175694 RepID=UPI0021E8B010|nr:serine carboxypeptidase 24-like [Andrographis paniculata]
MAFHKTLFHIYFFFSLVSINFARIVPEDQELDRISTLPGQPPVNFSQFSGYVTVNEQHGRALFYWLTEAPKNAHTKPLVLWLNGGPGCSSIAYGASEEIGAFRINTTASSLYYNEYSWNSLANILFLESPAGVGYSYTNTTSDLKDSGDTRTAEDALIFLIRWMSRFPQYKYRDFYLSGESYAGHYVPQLALKIQEYNKKHSQTFLNLKGFIVGNAVMDTYYDGLGTVTYWWSHSMISDKTYKTLLKHCKFVPQESSIKCDKIMNYAMNHEFGKIDQYSIYTPVCNKSNKTLRVSTTLKSILIGRRSFGYDPCTESYAEKYYNRPDVQKALHANLTGIPYKWTACSDVLLRHWKDSDASMLPTYKKLITAGLRIWIFSGDTDSVVPVTATRFSLSHLKLKIKTPWYPWYTGGQVGGWSEVYEGVTFATVRGAGHEVPLIQPRRGFVLFKSFLSGKYLPNK